MAYITGTGYDGKTWTLRDEDGRGVNQGTTVTDFRKERHIVDGGHPPHKPGSQGKVYTGKNGEGDYYPSVFGLRWVSDEEHSSPIKVTHKPLPDGAWLVTVQLDEPLAQKLRALLGQCTADVFDDLFDALNAALPEAGMLSLKLGEQPMDNPDLVVSLAERHGCKWLPGGRI